MKYLLIGKQTEEQTICDKVTIDGFDYYTSKVEIRLNDLVTNGYTVWLWKDDCSLLGIKKVIATNNPNIDIPQVVDEVYTMSNEFAFCFPIALSGDEYDCLAFGFRNGYHKSQETHPFSEKDMIEFGYWLLNDEDRPPFTNESQKELLKLWKEQQPKKVYYTQTTQP